MQGSAAFLFPLAFILPLTGKEPSTMYLHIIEIYIVQLLLSMRDLQSPFITGERKKESRRIRLNLKTVNKE